ncbi:hypothetical protein MAPG_04179 [Magnaporthiopsis poae ATCC 64411]|uniref:Uncharacterized protein n=1 Tax=Magnaporthiopsis poae (strain ATCC 64411 / 73-15) TaxID=644358 RepID=A0A0C4DW11_MAGP6|nr:hypothetical protein MAPG_04179 [Magnaporthiopsis poae ATCC 64411]
MAGVSNNPFRRKGPSFATPAAISVPDFPHAHTSSIAASGPSSAADHYFDEALEPASSSTVPTPASSSELFKQQLQSLPKSAQAPPSTSFQKPKPVKKVRVQSPPPSSPEESAFDADFEARFPPDPNNSTAGFALHHPPRSDSESDESEAAADDDPIIRRGSSVSPIQRFSDEGTGLTDRYADGRAGREGQDPRSVEQQQQASSASSGRIPPNPFQRTLGDMEQQYKDGEAGWAAAATSPVGKAPLDVDAFRRLLMTGQSGAPANPHGHHLHQQHANSAHPSLGHHQADAASVTDASSISRQSISDERSSSGHPATETPRTSHEISEPEGEEDQHGLLSSYTTQPLPRTMSRKKPAPPASRHGKLIKVELGKDGPNGVAQTRQDDAGLASPTGSSTDLNKPLPPAPRQQADDFRESVFDREAAGKIPEVDIDPDAPEAEVPAPRPPTPPNASHSITGPLPVPASPEQPQESLVSRFSTSATRKPAPPPRRQAHGRSDSRATVTSTSSMSSPIMTAYPPYSTLEESRTAGADQGHERKVSCESNSGSTPSPSNSVRKSMVMPPPPPPARHYSIRSGGGGGRPASIRSVDSTSRRVEPRESGSTSATGPPPPPPRPRGRVGSRTGGGTADSSKRNSNSGFATPSGGELTPGGAENILADLDALQREIDELRGQMA